MRKRLLYCGVTEHWKRLSRIVEFPSLETFKSRVGMILGALCQMNLLWPWGWAGWSPEVPSSSTPPAVKGLKKLAGTGHRARWGSGFHYCFPSNFQSLWWPFCYSRGFEEINVSSKLKYLFVTIHLTYRGNENQKIIKYMEINRQVKGKWKLDKPKCSGAGQDKYLSPER